MLHGLPLHQRRNAADELHAGTLELQLMTSTAQDRAAVRATGVRAAVNEDSTERSEADATYTLHNAAALAARYQRAIPGVAPRERRVLAASEDACFNAPALFRIRPHNVQFSGRAPLCLARRRRARVDVSRSAATACYVRLPPNLPDRDPSQRLMDSTPRPRPNKGDGTYRS